MFTFLMSGTLEAFNKIRIMTFGYPDCRDHSCRPEINSFLLGGFESAIPSLFMFYCPFQMTQNTYEKKESKITIQYPKVETLCFFK